MTSLFELFKIGVGPSSSHTVGPMRAAFSFVRDLGRAQALDRVCRLRTDLYGSLALTGIGHGTDNAVLLGMSGLAPDTVTQQQSKTTLERAAGGELLLAETRRVLFRRESDLLFHRDEMFPESGCVTHPNGMRFTAYDDAGEIVGTEVYYSIGGGFIVTGEHFSRREHVQPGSSRTVPYPFRSAAELLHIAEMQGLSIAEIMMANEIAMLTDESISRPHTKIDPAPAHQVCGDDGRLSIGSIGKSVNVPSADPAQQVRDGVMALASVMMDTIDRGMVTEGVLPGGLKVRRRATRLARRLREKGSADPLVPLDWVTVFAMAVNEENAAGGRVVTAPTNGAAGVIPAIARYYLDFLPGANIDGLIRYLLTAAAIGILYKENASISGAEVGCQGEVGVACSMAAGGLVAAQGGTNAQVEHAAEIAMEHNLGMTCDPIGGLVQIPCIERNAMGAVKAVNAARMAMNEPDEHKVSLDQVIRTMYLTGLDMQSRYKETSLAGLALNIIEC